MRVEDSADELQQWTSAQCCTRRRRDMQLAWGKRSAAPGSRVAEISSALKAVRHRVTTMPIEIRELVIRATVITVSDACSTRRTRRHVRRTAGRNCSAISAPKSSPRKFCPTISIRSPKRLRDFADQRRRQSHRHHRRHRLLSARQHPRSNPRTSSNAKPPASPKPCAWKLSNKLRWP